MRGDIYKAFLGYTKAQKFKFYLDSSGCPVIKYKILCTNMDWLPKEGGGIKLWQEDSEGQSLWPLGEPILVTYHSMRGV